MNPRSTDYEADALTTTPSRRLIVLFANMIIVTVDPGDSRGRAFFVEKLLISKVFCNFLKKLQRTPEWAGTF